MLTFTPAVRVYVATGPTDLRKSFDSLAALVDGVLGEDPYAGHVFLFSNRRRDRLKLLYWDRDGFALWYKRLEAGTFEWPTAEGGRAEIDATALALLLEGVELTSAVRRPRYQRPARGADENPGAR